MDSCTSQADNVFGPVVAACRSGFDFTLLFEQAIFSALPSALVILASVGRIGHLSRESVKTISGQSWSSRAVVKLTPILAFSAVQLCLVVLWASPANSPTKLSLPSSIVSLCVGLTLAALSYLHHSRSIRPSAILNIYLLFSILFDVTQARTLWLRQGNGTVAAVFTTGVVLKLLVLVMEMMEKRKILRAPYSSYPPEALGGVMNKSVFWWINSLLIKGSSSQLGLDDLYDLDRDLTIGHIHAKFRKSWERSDKKSPHALLITSLKCFWPNLVAIIIYRLCLIAFKFCQPLLIQRATSLLLEPDSPEKTNIGRALIGATALTYIGIALTTGQFKHNVYRFITMLRGGLTGFIYETTLHLDTSNTDESAALTLMSTDIDRMANGLEVLDAWWASPIEIAIAVVLLYRQVGLAFVVPIIISLIFIFISMAIKGVSSVSQKAWAEAIQRRVAATASVLYKMKGIKMTSLSETIGRQLQDLRVSELEISNKFRLVLGMSLTVAQMSHVMIPFATLCTHVLMMRSRNSPVLLDQVLAFTTLTLVSLLASPIRDIAQSTPRIAAAAGCLQRIQEYISNVKVHEGVESERNDAVEDHAEAEDSQLELQRLDFRHDLDQDVPLMVLKDATFSLKTSMTPMLHKVSISLMPGTWTVVTGPIGCGKSLLLLSLLGELPLLEGSIRRRPHLTLGFCAQDPWLSNLSIRQLIVGPNDFDEKRYWSVIDACHLHRDLKAFPSTDGTVIGSNGISLSGGQKQRLSLARALYSHNQLLVLDDVLGGLDPATEQKVVDSVFGRHGFLKHHNMAALLVTHSFHHARHADQVVVMGPGGIVLEQGSPDSVSLFKKVNEDNAQDIARVLGISENLVSATDGEPIQQQHQQQQHGHLQQQNEMMQEELSRQTGDMRLYAYYMSAIGWFNAIGLLVGFATYTVLLKFPSLLVRWWSDAEANTPGRQTNQYMGIYGMICGLCLVTLCLAEYTIFFRGIPRSSNSLHKRLLDAVMNAPYWFVVATDTGQLVNRFSQDMSLLCLDLPFAFVDTIFNAGNAVVGAVLITLASTYSVAICPALAVILYVLQKFYLLTSRQMRLLDLEAKSPLYTHFIQTLHGVTTIRAFGWQHASSAENAELLDRSQRPFYLMYSIQRWLNLVLDLLVAGVATLVVCLSTQLDNSSPGALGVSLLNIVTFSQDLTYLVRTWTDLETSLGAMARVRDFERNTPSEHLSNEQSTVPQDWPTGGEISIKDLSSSYKFDGDPILNGIVFDIKPGRKVGICGRTGSGKSTLLLTLLRMAEIQSGDVLVDGQSIKSVPRNELRRRLFSLPQDPLLLPGTVRFNADPFLEHSDRSILEALEDVGIREVISSRGGLDADMGSITLSKGQQQLFCLTRALLSKSRVILLDEITSNVDAATETAMMKVIERRFADRTVLAIAHRLHTIRNFDKIVVLDKGKIIEVGSPEELLSQESAFRGLWESSHGE